MFGRLATSFGIVLFVSSLAVAGQNTSTPTPQSQQPTAGQSDRQEKGARSKTKRRHHRKHRRSGNKGSTAPTTPPPNGR